MSKPRILALDYYFRRPHLDPLVALDRFEWILPEQQLHPDELPDCDLVVFTDERIDGYLPSISAHYHARGVPTLHFLDGVLEWRNLFENPLFDKPTIPSPPIHAISCASKLACIGPAQARQLEAMGHFGKCEVVGSPRIGSYAETSPLASNRSRVQRLLIATARTPTFDSQQEQLALDCLRQCKSELEDFDELQVEWRIPLEWSNKLGIQTSQTNTDGSEFKDALQRATLFASTPSTTVLEAMIAGLPTAIIDPFRRPKLMSAPWLVSGPGDLAAALPEMIEFPPLLRRHQVHTLADQLRNHPVERASLLISTMIEISQSLRRQGRELVLPTRILPIDDSPVPCIVEPVETLFPNYRPFESRSNEALRIEVAQLKRALAIRNGSRPSLRRFIGKLIKAAKGQSIR